MINHYFSCLTKNLNCNNGERKLLAKMMPRYVLLCINGINCRELQNGLFSSEKMATPNHNFYKD